MYLYIGTRIIRFLITLMRTFRFPRGDVRGSESGQSFVGGVKREKDACAAAAVRPGRSVRQIWFIRTAAQRADYNIIITTHEE